MRYKGDSNTYTGCQTLRFSSLIDLRISHDSPERSINKEYMMDFPFKRNIDRHNEPIALVIDLVQNLLQPKFTIEIKINDLIALYMPSTFS